MGFLDKMLAKQEQSVNRKIIGLLSQVEPQLNSRLGTVTCRENPQWVHQSIEVQTPLGKSIHFHRCRNVWHVGSGFEARPLANVDLKGGIVAGASFIANAVNFAN